jgi:flavin-dependent dehydrogenase
MPSSARRGTSPDSGVDVSVIGAGPAGATAALCLARRGWRVQLFSAGDQEPVGETLPPEITRVLRELDVFDDFLALNPLESPGIVSTWGSAERHEQDFLRNQHGSGWHVDRVAFDRMLRGKAQEAGAELISSRRRTEPSGFVIDATGASAIGEPQDVLLAIVLHLDDGRPADQRTFIEATRDGWWYSSPSSAMFFTDPQTYRQQGVDIAELFVRSPLTRSRVQATAVTRSRVVHARTGLNPAIATDRRLCVGDSASAYDPISGLGIWKALRMGAIAHDARALPEIVKREYAAYAAARRDYYAAETRWPESGFWRRRLAQSMADAM